MGGFQQPQNFNPGPGAVPGGGNLPPQQMNQPRSFETQKQWARSVSRSKQIKKSANNIIHTRQQFVEHLKQYGLGLVTSAVEYQQTQDFIASSYIIYENHNNYKERLGDFLARYPQLQQAALNVRDNLKRQNIKMQVIQNPEQQDQNQFGQFGGQF